MVLGGGFLVREESEEEEEEGCLVRRLYRVYSIAALARTPAIVEVGEDWDSGDGARERRVREGWGGMGVVWTDG